MEGKLVLVRADSAGVHFGTLISQNGQNVHLKDARRIWSWAGALSCSEIARDGLDIKSSKISAMVDEIMLPTGIEVILVSSNSTLYEIK